MDYIKIFHKLKTMVIFRIHHIRFTMINIPKQNYGRINKCLLPAAGYGTRFLPATKAVPKEMLPILTKTLLQYAV